MDNMDIEDNTHTRGEEEKDPGREVPVPTKLLERGTYSDPPGDVCQETEEIAKECQEKEVRKQKPAEISHYNRVQRLALELAQHKQKTSRLVIELESVYSKQQEAVRACRSWKEETLRLRRINSEQTGWFSNGYRVKGLEDSLKQKKMEIAGLRQQLAEAQISEQNSQRSAEEARKDAAEAITTSNNLFQMLDSSVVKRKIQGAGRIPEWRRNSSQNAKASTRG